MKILLIRAQSSAKSRLNLRNNSISNVDQTKINTYIYNAGGEYRAIGVSPLKPRSKILIITVI